MAKVQHPLYSISASGKIGDTKRYLAIRMRKFCRAKRSHGSTRTAKQSRYTTLIAEASRLWLTATGKGPESTYTDYIRGIAKDSYFYIGKDTILEWDYDTLLTID